MCSAFFLGGIRTLFAIGYLFTQQINQYSQVLKINLDHFFNTKKFLSRLKGLVWFVSCLLFTM